MKTQTESPVTAQHTPSYMAQTLIALASHYKGDTSLTLLHAANAVDSHAELLAALESSLAWMEAAAKLESLQAVKAQYVVRINQARAAIARAKGQ